MTSVEMSDFFSRGPANDGVKLPLTLPGGKATEHWIRVRGADCDEFRAASLEVSRHAVRLARIEDPRERAEALKEQTLLMQATLVKEWSFEQPCTPQNVVAFLREAPYIADAVDRVATQRALFTGRSSVGSEPTPEASSSSPSP